MLNLLLSRFYSCLKGKPGQTDYVKPVLHISVCMAPILAVKPHEGEAVIASIYSFTHPNSPHFKIPHSAICLKELKKNRHIGSFLAQNTEIKVCPWWKLEHRRLLLTYSAWKKWGCWARSSLSHLGTNTMISAYLNRITKQPVLLTIHTILTTGISLHSTVLSTQRHAHPQVNRLMTTLC